MKRNTAIETLLLIGVLLVGSVPLFSQATATARIQGTVTDSSNAVIVGAEVTAVNNGTKLTRNTTTNGSGDYVIDQLPVGAYNIKVTKSGFATSVTKIELFVDHPRLRTWP